MGKGELTTADLKCYRAIIRSLLDCCEMNMDDMEEETRETIRKAEEFLTSQ